MIRLLVYIAFSVSRFLHSATVVPIGFAVFWTRPSEFPYFSIACLRGAVIVDTCTHTFANISFADSNIFAIILRVFIISGVICIFWNDRASISGIAVDSCLDTTIALAACCCFVIAQSPILESPKFAIHPSSQTFFPSLLIRILRSIDEFITPGILANSAAMSHPFIQMSAPIISMISGAIASRSQNDIFLMDSIAWSPHTRRPSTKLSPVLLSYFPSAVDRIDLASVSYAWKDRDF